MATKPLFAFTLNDIVGPLVSGAVTLPRYARRGNYSFVDVACTDHAGNRSPAISFPLVVVQQQGEDDLEPPTITALSASPTRVDVSLASAPVTIVIELSDAVSLPDSCFVIVRSNNSVPLSYQLTLPAVDGVAGRYAAELVVPRNTPPYSFLIVASCFDDAGNLAPTRQFNSIPQFTVLPPGDMMAPVLDHVGWSPTAFGDTGGSTEVEVRVRWQWEREGRAGVAACRNSGPMTERGVTEVARVAEGYARRWSAGERRE